MENSMWSLYLGDSIQCRVSQTIPLLLGASPCRWPAGDSHPTNSGIPAQHHCDDVTQKRCHHTSDVVWRHSGLMAKLYGLKAILPEFCPQIRACWLMSQMWWHHFSVMYLHQQCCMMMSLFVAEPPPPLRTLPFNPTCENKDLAILIQCYAFKGLLRSLKEKYCDGSQQSVHVKTLPLAHLVVLSSSLLSFNPLTRLFKIS